MEVASVACSSAKVTIRVLAPSDLYLVVPFAQAYVLEQPRAGGFSVQRFLDFWITLQNQFSGVILVAELDGLLIGGISGYVIPDAYAARMLAQEGFFYVVPEHRHSRVALDLFRAFLEWAESTPAEAQRVGYLEGPFARPLAALFTRHGFRQLETHFERERGA